jgi:YD repeat-containing protein
MQRRHRFAIGIALAGLLGSAAAPATETITYTYDARGRVVKVVHTGTVNNNNQACYKYDKADNRTNVQANVGSLPACP